jgi:hypothetical protein
VDLRGLENSGYEGSNSATSRVTNTLDSSLGGIPRDLFIWVVRGSSDNV